MMGNPSKIDSCVASGTQKRAMQFLIGLLALQPFLDVISYFMLRMGSETISTSIRFIMFTSVSLLGFYLTNRKRLYGVFYGVIFAYWACHIISCIIAGYQNPILDAGEFLKLIQFPLWTLTFITIIKRYQVDTDKLKGVFALNFMAVAIVILLSLALSMPAYTYDYAERGMQIGVLGWFGVPNSQSAILPVLVMGLLMWAHKRGIVIFSISVASGFTVLYFTGTRLTFYMIFLIAALVSGLTLIQKDLALKKIAPILVLICTAAMCFFLKPYSPMAQRQAKAEDSLSFYQNKTDEIMEQAKQMGYKKGDEITQEIKDIIQQVYIRVYGGIGKGGLPLLGDLMDRFGIDTVMEIYGYETDARVLYDARTKKLKTADLIMGQRGIGARLFGFEYKEVYIGDNIYDAENDITVLPYYYGYVGSVLYLSFVGFFVLYAICAFLKGGREYLTIDNGVCIAAYGFLVVAAQNSGQVLRRPNVTVYLSLLAALIYISGRRSIKLFKSEKSD